MIATVTWPFETAVCMKPQPSLSFDCLLLQSAIALLSAVPKLAPLPSPQAPSGLITKTLSARALAEAMSSEPAVSIARTAFIEAAICCVSLFCDSESWPDTSYDECGARCDIGATTGRQEGDQASRNATGIEMR